MQPPARIRASASWICCMAALLVPLPALAVSSISVDIGEMHGAAGSARNVSLDYQLNGKLQLRGEIKPANHQQTAGADGQPWVKTSLDCSAFSIQPPVRVHCNDGQFSSGKINVPFTLALDLPQDNQPLDLTLQLKAASFSDAAGLHAGEKVSGNINLHATQNLQGWQWHTVVDWQGGEVFWQPFYFASGGHKLMASGQLDKQWLTVEDASLELKNVGVARFSGKLRLPNRSIQAVNLDAPTLDLTTLYPLILKPLLEKTAFNNLEVAGQAGLSFAMHDGEFDAFQLDLHDADMEDKNGSFALYKINASLPWSYDEARVLKLAYAGGRLLKLPLGQTALTANVDRYSLTAASLKLPVLDGAVALSDVSAGWVNDQWHWHLRANLLPISMTEFSHALSWPTMQGQLSATIPLVTYSDGQLTTDGTLLFNVFNGTATIAGLNMQNPLGQAPVLSANVRFRNLDLGALTRTFSFGAIEGKLDGDVNNLQLVDWQPVQFDAALYSSPGDYKKKISQRAVENISALGGAGATAAIQRSFLRFFDEFNYKMIGLSCRLRSGQCLLG
ncbi:MAG TPA: hypothetical protein VFX01_08005, partial [Methylophilaceae bacterium]|nr:hypothetical protein [Methylophilaceae bacterium]